MECVILLVMVVGWAACYKRLVPMEVLMVEEGGKRGERTEKERGMTEPEIEAARRFSHLSQLSQISDWAHL